jgi:hypothetical protein
MEIIILSHFFVILAHNSLIYFILAIGFFEHVNLIYGTVSEFCTLSSCPDMMGPGPRYNSAPSLLPRNDGPWTQVEYINETARDVA